MTPPHRFFDGQAGPLERQLLRALAEDGPSDRSRARVAAALGLGAGITGAASSASAGGAGAAAAGKLGLSSLVPWAGTLLLGGAVALGIGAGLRRTPEPAAPLSIAEPRLDAPAPAPASAPEPALLAPVEPPAASEVSPPPTASRAASPASALSREVSLLQRARAAARARRWGDVAAITATHARRFSAGELAQEASALRVEALVRLGRIDRAESLAQAFFAEHPDSPYADHLRALLTADAGGR